MPLDENRKPQEYDITTTCSQKEQFDCSDQNTNNNNRRVRPCLTAIAITESRSHKSGAVI